MYKMLESFEGIPINYGCLAKGNSSVKETLDEQIYAGSCGYKIHEDWGSTPAAIRACLDSADRLDVQVAIHTDTLNESGYVEDSIAAMDGRTIHTYHTEGAGWRSRSRPFEGGFDGQRASVIDQPHSSFRYQLKGRIV